jgi:F-type H+-transporting ATPase subunit gamma
LIPCSINIEENENKEDSNIVNFEFEPDEKEILSELLPKNLAIQIYKAILESGAGEQGARMAAMDNATRNAGEMIDKLKLSYNRQRQAIITGELIEIISGAEAL